METKSDAVASSNNSTERLLVVGGGGCRGAWAGGFVKRLVLQHNKPYRYVFGTSTGSLMAPLIVLNDFDTLKEAYTSVTQKDIFNVNPFNKSGGLHLVNAVWRLIRKKTCLGESYNLRNTICKFLKEEYYSKIVNASPELQFTVCTMNYKDGVPVYKASSKDLALEEMINWMWASSNQPVLMNFVDQPYLKNGSYVDGGVKNIVPVIKALKFAKDHQVSAIDVIVNKPKEAICDKNFVPGDMLKNLLRLTEYWEAQIQEDNIRIATLLNQLSKKNGTLIKESTNDATSSVKLTFYYMPQKLYEENFNDLLFNKGSMNHLWQEGECGGINTLAVNPTFQVSLDIIDQLE